MKRNKYQSESGLKLLCAAEKYVSALLKYRAELAYGTEEAIASLSDDFDSEKEVLYRAAKKAVKSGFYEKRR